MKFRQQLFEVARQKMSPSWTLVAHISCRDAVPVAKPIGQPTQSDLSESIWAFVALTRIKKAISPARKNVFAQPK